jgi:hypothetical protein
MITRVRCILTVCCLALGILLPFQSSTAKSTQPAIDSAAIEATTTISNGVCSNATIGVSYHLPKGLKTEDAAAMEKYGYNVDAKMYGTGPEARWFLWGYSQRKSMALLCGAGGQASQVQMMATSASSFAGNESQLLEQLLGGLGQQLGAKPSAARHVSVNGTNLECSDLHAALKSRAGSKVDVWATGCVDVVGPYVVMWVMSAPSEPEWNDMVASLNSVTLFKPRPQVHVGGGSQRMPAAGEQIAPDFQGQLNAFLKAWLVDRSPSKTMAFFDRAAYSAPPLVGTYCTGWYHYGSPAQQAEKLMSENLMGVPKDFPNGTRTPTIFTAWDRLPPQWVSASENDVAKDHFLVASLDSASLNHIFSGVFASSPYGNYLRSVIGKGRAYWVVFPEVMPDDDIFVIFTVWQMTGHDWKITDMDIVCQ